MKKLPLLIFLLVIILCGCTVIYDTPKDRFGAYFTAEHNNIKIKGEIISSSNNRMILKFTYPKTMDGYLYEYKNDVLNIKYKNYIIKTEPSFLPDSDFSKTVFNTLKSLKNGKNLRLSDGYYSELEYKGSCESGDYTIISDKDNNYINKISFKENKTEIVFKKILKTE